jgi:hypothetical protein
MWPTGFGVRLVVVLASLLAHPAAPWTHAATQDDPIVWSATRKLTWDDFKAKPRRELDGARSAISHTIQTGCRNGALQARVLTLFHPEQSSVTYRIISSGLASRVGLAHEQLHFDLAEVFARRIRQMYTELAQPCPRSDDALQALADPILLELQAEQRRFDDQTSRGELEARQIDWAKKIAAALDALKTFVGPSDPRTLGPSVGAKRLDRIELRGAPGRDP